MRSPTVELRPDQKLIADMVAADSRVLEVGCRDGVLLEHLVRDKRVSAHGLEIEQASVNQAVARGLFVVQGDANCDLADYPDDSFDYVILSRTLQAVDQPRQILEVLARIGRHVLVSIPNFGHWRVRVALLVGGRIPVTATLDQSWFDTENIHLCTLADFRDLVADVGLRIERFQALNGKGHPVRLAPRFANLLASQALYVLGR